MATVNLGRIKPVNKGTWSSATTYAVDDFVQYTDSGVLSTYIAVASGSNQVPSTSGTENSSYWKYMSKGTNIAVGNNKIMTTDGSGNPVGIAMGTAEKVLKVNAAGNAFEFGQGAKAIEIHAQSYENIGTIGGSADYFSYNFTPTISGKVFVQHSGAQRHTVATHSYVEYYFNNGSGEVVQHSRGVGYPSSGTTHSQGWSVGFVPTTGANSDSSTPITVTANTQCTLRVRASAGASLGPGTDTGKDHHVMAIVYES